MSDADFEDDADRDCTIQMARETLEALQQGVSREGVFSSNEEVEDVNTSMLPMLGADYYLGSLLLKLPFTSPETRLQMLENAEAFLCKYLNACEQFCLLEDGDRHAWHSMLKDGGGSTTTRGLAVGRDQKIERFRRQKRTRQRMKEIEDELTSGEVKDDLDDSEDDGIRREKALLVLSSLAIDALDELSGLSKETEMLRHMVEAKEHAHPPWEKQGIATLEDKQAAYRANDLEVTHISRVGTNLRIRKEDVRGAVFKPTVERPSMTVEEFGEIELERARQRQAKEKYDKQPSTRRRCDQLEEDGDEDNEELVKQATYRDREWDNWKDENPRGAGNKANKII